MTAIVRGALVTVYPIVQGIATMREATLGAQREVVEAIGARDAAAAERAMSRLIDVTAEEVGRAFSFERREDSSSPPIDESQSAGA